VVVEAASSRETSVSGTVQAENSAAAGVGRVSTPAGLVAERQLTARSRKIWRKATAIAIGLKLDFGQRNAGLFRFRRELLSHNPQSATHNLLRSYND
jgi:hypothetical protein